MPPIHYYISLLRSADMKCFKVPGVLILYDPYSAVPADTFAKWDISAFTIAMSGIHRFCCIKRESATNYLITRVYRE